MCWVHLLALCAKQVCFCTHDDICNGCLSFHIIYLYVPPINCPVECSKLVVSSVLACCLYLFVFYAGFFLDASKLLCGLSNDVAQSDSHVILLKYLADAKEIPVAIEHVKWVRQTSPSMLQIVSAELLASLSSSSRLEPTRQLVQTIQEISGLK